MKNKILIVVTSWLMVLATMIIIFNFWEQSADKSAETSGGVIKDILETVLPDEEITDEVVKKFQPPIRKIAHFCIFMLLGFCLANAFQRSFNLKAIIMYALSFASVTLYAGLDEFHQSFVAERGPSIKDVLIDSSGGLTGILIFVLMIFILKKIDTVKFNKTKKDRE